MEMLWVLKVGRDEVCLRESGKEVACEMALEG